MPTLPPALSAANDHNAVGATVRVVLHNASWEDYERLHDAMAAIGFSKIIVSDRGEVFELPDAEYFTAEAISPTLVRDVVVPTADAIKAGAYVLVTEATRIAWRLPIAN